VDGMAIEVTGTCAAPDPAFATAGYLENLAGA